jgi:hypothetical protein
VLILVEHDGNQRRDVYVMEREVMRGIRNLAYSQERVKHEDKHRTEERYIKRSKAHLRDGIQDRMQQRQGNR